jgi:hypothetical protein
VDNLLPTKLPQVFGKIVAEINRRIFDENNLWKSDEHFDSSNFPLLIAVRVFVVLVARIPNNQPPVSYLGIEVDNPV